MDMQDILWCLRITARISFVFFLCAFAGRGLLRFWPGVFSRWLDASKRAWLFSLAASHTFHLAFIVTLAVNLGGAEFVRQVRMPTIVVGGIAYLFIYTLVLAAAFPSGPRLFQSTRFQAVGYYLLWAIFAFVFLGSVVHSLFYLPFAVAALAGLALRIFAATRMTEAEVMSPASR